MDAILNHRYKLIEQVGTGGMALVYQAQDLSLGRLVAVKVLRDNLTTTGDFITRFQNEARAAANLTHPNIVTVHDFGRDGTRSYIVMEYVEGDNLKSVIRAHAPLTLDRAIDLTIQICAGVGYAHRAGLVHCDIKPQNILVTSEGRVKVTDFGIARAFATAAALENTDTVWGSPQYFSPEQAAGEPPTPASDVYSIGIVLFELLAGRLPFIAQNPQQLAMMHIRDEPPRLTLFNPNVPETVERIVNKVLAKEPAARYRTADHLGRILVSYREQAHERTDSHPPLAASPPAARPAPPSHAAPAVRSRPVEPEVEEAAIGEEEEEVEAGMDWLAVLLGLVAFIAVLGLIPLWLFVASQYNLLP
ncbi:MAG: serine/threonine protein kinase [Chloroflexi bacterium]|nr:serine/threonine protein kinase [Chloroflexota bacterium]